MSKALFEIVPQADPCGECHLAVGETCSICGATNHGSGDVPNPAEPVPNQSAAMAKLVELDALLPGGVATGTSGGKAARPSSRASLGGGDGKQRLTKTIGINASPATVFPRYEPEPE